MSRFGTVKGRLLATVCKTWCGPIMSDLCEHSQQQTMTHIVNSCPRTKINKKISFAREFDRIDGQYRDLKVVKLC